MEPNGLHSGLFSSISSEMLGVEMPLHPQSQQQQQQNPQNSHNQNPTNPQNPHHYPQMVAYSHHHDTDLHHTQAQQSVKQHGNVFTSKPKQQLSPLSDEDELGLTPDDSAGDGKRKSSPSPWQRMKWTDSMVKLLILAVLYIGDEAGSEGNDKKKTGALLQKKGKWKSVSRAMMERGFYVSPQQCEDKFNDLNKRYKRVNEILGKGTACLVVENQSLLETMDLSPKMKEEVKKLLNSKHLFFKEMCAYHNTSGHGVGTSGSGANHISEVAIEPSQVQQQQGQRRCLHSSENAQPGANLSRAETEGSKLVKVGSEEEDDMEDESDDEDDYDDDDEAVEGNLRSQQNGHGKEDEDDNDEKLAQKRARKVGFPVLLSPLLRQLSCEVVNVIQDGAKSAWEKKQWMKMRLLQVEEQQVNYQYQAFELERQRLKWVKFSSKKEREMERAVLENERRRLENERMVLVLRQKELQLLDLHHHHQQHSSTKKSDPSSITG